MAALTPLIDTFSNPVDGGVLLETVRRPLGFETPLTTPLAGRRNRHEVRTRSAAIDDIRRDAFLIESKVPCWLAEGRVDNGVLDDGVTRHGRASHRSGPRARAAKRTVGPCNQLAWQVQSSFVAAIVVSRPSASRDPSRTDLRRPDSTFQLTVKPGRALSCAPALLPVPGAARCCGGCAVHVWRSRLRRPGSGSCRSRSCSSWALRATAGWSIQSRPMARVSTSRAVWLSSTTT